MRVGLSISSVEKSSFFCLKVVSSSPVSVFWHVLLFEEAVQTWGFFVLFYLLVFRRTFVPSGMLRFDGSVGGFSK